MKEEIPKEFVRFPIIPFLFFIQTENISISIIFKKVSLVIKKKKNKSIK